jgi:hypothetical protein
MVAIGATKMTLGRQQAASLYSEYKPSQLHAALHSDVHGGSGAAPATAVIGCGQM